jgi:hypothetical protein
MARKLSLSGPGQLTLDAYGSGTFTGTATSALGVTASGEVIELSGPVVDTTICALTDSTTVVWDVAACPVASVTLTASRILQVDNATQNGIYILDIIQDGTGGWGFTWPGSFTWQGGTAGVLSAAAASVDELTIRRASGGDIRAILTKDWQ